MAYKPERRDYIVSDRHEKIMAAIAHYKENKSTIDVLMTKFNLSIQDARNAYNQGQKQILEETTFKENIEREIDGLDWKYNPEKSIEGIEIPRYN